MKALLRNTFLMVVLAIASTLYGAVPPMTVIVSDASNKVVHKTTISTNGTFTTGNLTPGNYIVQFTSNSAGKGKYYSLVISAGKKKMASAAVPAEKFAGGGVAMKLDVGAGLPIIGQVAPAGDVKIDPKTGKTLVFIPPTVGSHLPGRWVPEDSADAIATLNVTSEKAGRMKK